MFSSSLLGVLYRPTTLVVLGPNNCVEPVTKETLVSRLAAFFGLTKRLAIYPAEITHTGGFCYAAAVPENFSKPSNEDSRLDIYENGQRLQFSYSLHDDIRALGRGRYSHWDGRIYFSTPDNSDPTTNGRRYEIQEN